MQFYAVSTGDIKPVDLEIFIKIQAVLGALPDVIFNQQEKGWGYCKNQFSCHLICRALSRHFETSVHDGHFATRYQHSWLKPKGGSSIIDPYPVAGAAPIIVAAHPASPWQHLYQESVGLNAAFFTKTFLSRLNKTDQVVGKTIQRLGLL